MVTDIREIDGIELAITLIRTDNTCLVLFLLLMELSGVIGNTQRLNLGVISSDEAVQLLGQKIQIILLTSNN